MLLWTQRSTGVPPASVQMLLGVSRAQQTNHLSQKIAKDAKTKLGPKGPAPGTTSRQAQRSDGSQRWLSLCDLCDLLLQIPWCLACQIPGQPTASLRSARCPKCSLGRLTVIPLKEFFRRRPSLQPRVPCQLLSEKTSDPKGSRTLPFAPLRPSQKGCLDQRQPASVSPPQLDS
jgi:hypothetical protein